MVYKNSSSSTCDELLGDKDDEVKFPSDPELLLTCFVFDLQGGEYEFRVKAVNAAGPSRPSATAGPLVIKDQTCE